MILTTIKKIEEEGLESLRVKCTGQDVETDRLNADDIAAKALNDLGLHELAREFRKIVNRG